MLITTTAADTATVTIVTATTTTTYGTNVTCMSFARLANLQATVEACSDLISLLVDFEADAEVRATPPAVVEAAGAEGDGGATGGSGESEHQEPAEGGGEGSPRASTVVDGTPAKAAATPVSWRCSAIYQLTRMHS
jgi:hypothetical protein